MSARIQLTDTFLDIAHKMSEGNPGALNVIINLVKEGEKIDPDAAMGGLMLVLDLDTLGIYGSHIWILYKDVCGQSLVNLVALLRAWQLGFIGKEEIAAASVSSAQPPKRIDLVALLAKVRERLPDFAKGMEP